MRYLNLPPSAPRPSWPRAGVWASVLAVVLVLVVVWASFFSGPGPGGTAADRTSTSPTQEADPGSPAGEKTPKSDAEPGPADGSKAEAALARSVKRFRAAQRKLAQQVSTQLDRRSQPVEFRVASLNVLGASHTGVGGRPGFPGASTRMDMAIAALRNNAIDVVGLQEFESSQYGMFTARAGEYSLYPGLSLGDKSVRFNIAWRSSMWKMVEAHTLSIPYAGGSRIEMPVVLLESIATGRRAWFANFHNPADTPNLGNNARWRSEAAGIEISHLTELRATGGYPVISTGDYNERAEIFCRFTAGGVFSAAAGGSTGGSCSPPSGMQVDWIFGSTGVSFADYRVTDIGRATDHNLVHSQATLTEVE